MTISTHRNTLLYFFFKSFICDCSIIYTFSYDKLFSRRFYMMHIKTSWSWFTTYYTFQCCFIFLELLYAVFWSLFTSLYVILLVIFVMRFCVFLSRTQFTIRINPLTISIKFRFILLLLASITCLHVSKYLGVLETENGRPTRIRTRTNEVGAHHALSVTPWA